MGEPARLRGRRFQALQTHTHDPTWGDVVPSRRAVGLSATMILAIHFRRGKQSFAPTTRCQTIFYNRKGQNHFRFNPSRTPVRTFSPFRGEPPNSLARNFSPRREHRDPGQPAGNNNVSVTQLPTPAVLTDCLRECSTLSLAKRNGARRRTGLRGKGGRRGR